MSEAFRDSFFAYLERPLLDRAPSTPFHSISTVPRLISSSKPAFADNDSYAMLWHAVSCCSGPSQFSPSPLTWFLRLARLRFQAPRWGLFRSITIRRSESSNRQFTSAISGAPSTRNPSLLPENKARPTISFSRAFRYSIDTFSATRILALPVSSMEIFSSARMGRRESSSP